MAEPATPTAQPPAEPATGTPPAPDKGTGSEPAQPAESTFDPSKLSDDDFNKIYEDKRLYRHDRFKSLSERAKKAEELEKAQTDAEKKRLEDEGKWKERAELAEKEAGEAKTLSQNLAIKGAIQAEAAKIGVVDLEAVATLIDRTNIKIGENGQVEGIEEALKGLLDSKPYLKGKPQQPVGSGSNPGSTENGTKTYKMSQLQDHKFYMENEKDILAALKLGLVEDDISAGNSPQAT